MSDQSFTPPPAFKFAFQPAEQIPDGEFHRFERYVPRRDGETNDAYATRLDQLGLAVKVKSDEARDFVGFCASIQAATARGVPLALITALGPSLPSAADLARADESKTTFLDEARRNTNRP